MNTKPMPDGPAPSLELQLTDGTTWSLDAQRPESFTMIVMYRGKHCPVCEKYLKTTQTLADRYEELGVSLVAVSMDDVERAKDSKEEWGIDRFPVAYGMSEATALAWGLFDRIAEPDALMSTVHELAADTVGADPVHAATIKGMCRV